MEVIKTLIKNTGHDYEFKANMFSLYRNIYVFIEDKIFYNKEKINNLLIKERNVLDERENFLLFLEEEFEDYVGRIKKKEINNNNQNKQNFWEYGVKMLISTIKYLCKEQINNSLFSTKNFNTVLALAKINTMLTLDMVKRFSNKLKHRQASVQIPFF